MADDILRIVFWILEGFWKVFERLVGCCIGETSCMVRRSDRIPGFTEIDVREYTKSGLERALWDIMMILVA